MSAAPRLRDRIFLSAPWVPSDLAPEGLDAYKRLAEDHQLSSSHQMTQFAALSAASLLVEALERVGRDLSRTKLVTELEGFYGFEAGLMPAITYGLNGRIGALGAYVLAPGPAGGSSDRVPEWVTPR